MAKAWSEAQGKRPRASAYATIARFMLADPDMVPDLPEDRLEAVLTAALAQYHAGNHQAGPAVPSPPLGDDLQPKRLQSVPDHQQPDQAGDSETAGQEPDRLRLHPATPATVAEFFRPRLEALDERLAGLQELVGPVPAIHELLVALIKAMVPVIELAGELTASDAKLESMAGEVRDLAGQLGITAETITPAQERARSVAEQNGWIPPVRAGDPAPPSWGDRPLSAAEARNLNQQASQPAVLGMTGTGLRAVSRLYGAHIAPEPDWARYHDIGEPQ